MLGYVFVEIGVADPEEREAAADHLIVNDPQGPDIGFGVVIFATHHLGAHVKRGPEAFF